MNGIQIKLTARGITMDKRLKVIIADDSIEFGQVCMAALKIYGFEVFLGPKDGRQVIEMITREVPDVVLIGAFMPSLDGIGTDRKSTRRNSSH